MIRRHWRLLAAVGCLVLAVCLALLGGELVRWQRQLSRDDQLFRATPLRAGLWQVSGSPGVDPSKWILGLGDDLALRRAYQQFWRARPLPSFSISRPTLSTDLAEAQVSLAKVAESDPDPARRAAALNLMGVLQLSAAAPQELAARAAYLRQGIGFFENAVRLDPSSVDAKANLELALRTTREELEQIGGAGPTGGTNEGSGSGAGESGSGY